ncbi:MAG TPA: sigma-70 family RNA polymerase sigma factor [Gemmatimonadaceae bacterium]|nr:sigma-70 family RNA polymerase sigma factor [Gemmatimonadaceae bacterium]
MNGTAPVSLTQLLDASDNANREAAWEELIGRHTRLIMAVARSLGGDHDAAMERYSYVLGKLREWDFRRLRSFDPNAGATFSTWLTVTARRLCLDLHRAKYGRHRAHDDDKSSVLRAARRALNDSFSSDVDTDTLSDGNDTAESALIRFHRDECLRSELSRLTPRERLLLTLRFEDDLPATKIASVLGLPTPFHVYRKINAILAKLRDQLHARGIDDSDG